jgi:hypothetical protein
VRNEHEKKKKKKNTLELEDLTNFDNLHRREREISLELRIPKEIKTRIGGLIMIFIETN